MLRGDVLQDWFELRAFWLDKGTARVKGQPEGGSLASTSPEDATVHIRMSRSPAEARTYLRHAPWRMRFPGLSWTLTELALNLFGDGVGEVIDLHLRKV